MATGYETIRELFESSCTKLEKLETEGLIDVSSEVMGIRDILELDLAQYIMFLISLDETVTDREVRIFGQLTGRSDDKIDIFEYIRTHHLRSVQFMKTVPRSFEIIADAILKLQEEPGDKANELEELRSILDRIYVLWRMSGRFLISVPDLQKYEFQYDHFATYMGVILVYLRERGLSKA